MSKLSPALYERYLSGTCTPEEEMQVLQYFKDHPSALADHMNETGWEKFEKYTLRNQQDVRKTLTDIKQKIRSRKMTTIRVLTATAAAASIALAILLTWPVTIKQRQPIAAVNKAVLIPEYILWENKSDTQEIRTLKDGSRVSLQPGATLRYTDNFTPDARKLWLTGGARFWVMKDSNRPFSVISREIVTTAIGTSFSVQTVKRNNDSALRVRLFEGKVSIHKVHPGKDGKVYLQPGEELTYLPLSDKMIVKNNRTAPAAKPPGEPYVGDLATSFKYKRAPLHKALAILSAYYKIPVTADKKSISGIYITAEFNKTDQLEVILKTIAALNDLNLKGNDLEGYHLSN